MNWQLQPGVCAGPLTHFTVPKLMYTADAEAAVNLQVSNRFMLPLL